MSQENVEIVRRCNEAFSAQDLPTATSLLDPAVVLDPGRVGGPDVSYGREAIGPAIGRFVGAFEDYTFAVERYVDLGAGAVLAAATERGRGKSSGVPVQRSFAFLYTVIDGRIARITVFPDEKAALEAAGLRE
jgi:ketosteroid isomerase-like protein